MRAVRVGGPRRDSSSGFASVRPNVAQTDPSALRGEITQLRLQLREAEVRLARQTEQQDEDAMQAGKLLARVAELEIALRGAREHIDTLEGAARRSAPSGFPVDAASSGLRARPPELDMTVALAIDTLSELDHRDELARDARKRSVTVLRRLLDQISGPRRSVSSAADSPSSSGIRGGEVEMPAIVRTPGR